VLGGFTAHSGFRNYRECRPYALEYRLVKSPQNFKTFDINFSIFSNLWNVLYIDGVIIVPEIATTFLIQIQIFFNCV